MPFQLKMFQEESKPHGLQYLPNFISLKEEAQLLRAIEKNQWQDVKLHGIIAQRKVIHYGLDYEYSSRKTSPAPEAPSYLQPLMRKVARHLRVSVEELAEILISYYPVGAPIGWHRDAPMFDSLLGISLGSSCTLKFRLISDSGTLRYDQPLERRSAYILESEARWKWQHHIPPVKEERYSITFRTLVQ